MTLPWRPLLVDTSIPIKSGTSSSFSCASFCASFCRALFAFFLSFWRCDFVFLVGFFLLGIPGGCGILPSFSSESDDTTRSGNLSPSLSTYSPLQYLMLAGVGSVLDAMGLWGVGLRWCVGMGWPPWESAVFRATGGCGGVGKGWTGFAPVCEGGELLYIGSFGCIGRI